MIVPLPFALSAHAQSVPWRIYRRDDLGFQVEMPGEPNVDTSQSESRLGQDQTPTRVKIIGAALMHGGAHFAASYYETDPAVPAERLSAILRGTIASMVAPSAQVRETPLTLGGWVGGECVGEDDRSYAAARFFARGERSIQLFFFSDRGVDRPSVSRFFESLALLPR